ncbi:MAG: MFS transporter [Rhodothermales bacterium]
MEARRSTRHDVDVDEPAGYRELVRENVHFRRLWLGNLISLLGDWFNTIALYTLVAELTGSPFALGAVFITKMLPSAVASPVAGLIVDRFNRRRLMIVSDLLRAVVVLGLLLVKDAGDVYLVYVLTTMQVVIGSVFEPAKSSSLPNITTPRELLTANTIMSATWSVMLAAGAALGGFATQWLGVEAVFIIDSMTYLVSAYFIYRTVIPQETEEAPPSGFVRAAARDIREGFRHLVTHPRIGRIALAKATWAAAGGGLVFMLTLLGEALSPQATAIGIGILFATRGLGTGVGPVLARWLFVDRTLWPTVIGSCVLISGVMYAAIGLVPWTYLVAGLVLVAHAASGANWVLATVMLQKRTVDRVRGRVFAAEWLFVMLADSVSIFVASVLLETSLFDLQRAFVVFGTLQALCGAAWLAIVVPRENAAEHADPGS